MNDDFTKCPDELQEILNDEEKRKKLVIYINPPYAEASTTRTKTGTGQNKDKVARGNFVFEKYSELIGTAANEVFAEFFIRIYEEIQSCKLAQFSKLKALSASNFAKFRKVFRAKLEKLFVIPADTFDNVNGQFPIGFAIWDTGKTRTQESITTDADVYDCNGNFIGKKKFFGVEKGNLIIDWFRHFYDQKGNPLAYIRIIGTDVQNNGGVHISSKVSPNDYKKHMFAVITEKNLMQSIIYFAVRMCIEPTWLNDRDQFLFPNDGWQSDREFQGDCLIYTLFHGQNRISSNGVSVGNSNPCGNHFIPFTEQQVGCKKSFKSNFMSSFIRDFLDGRITVSDTVTDGAGVLFTQNGNGKSLDFPNPCGNLSSEAQAVYNAGLELWKYYHSQTRANPDASFYDIRKFFQGETKGRMNNGSDDAQYMELIGDLREKMKLLAKKIEPKVYEYGFLK